ncbi:putative ferric-chelate reductase 1 [Mytilus edulis]|uniref:putative ferric-chelate reductase 1 n=1 Tax=Mytilus edulis TaxID=6550 RepID=UPI0039F03E9C
MTAIKTYHAVLPICILYLLNNVNLVNGFSKDSTCGGTHGCWGDCDGGCSFLLTWMSSGSGVNFKMKASLSTNADQWAGFGISTSASMQNASVTSCLMTSSGASFNPENSYNAASGNTNSVVSSPLNGLTATGATYADNILTCELSRTNTNSDAEVFDLTTDYYILFAKGTLSGGTKNQHTFTDKTAVLVSFQATQDLAGGVAIIKPFTSILIMLSVSQIVLFSM